MDQELQIAIAEFVTPYIEDRHRILNIAAAVEELSVACPGVDREQSQIRCENTLPLKA